MVTRLKSSDKKGGNMASCPSFLSLLTFNPDLFVITATGSGVAVVAVVAAVAVVTAVVK